ncbi:MAG: hypothetical protein ACFCUU_02325 [Cyclobacteriaceae bacterium]
MNVKNGLRISLVKKIQQLSDDKLVEANYLLGKIENQVKSKDKTLKLAGTWEDMDDDFFTEMTEKLHENRSNDRQFF